LTAATTTAATAAGFVLRFVDLERTATHVLTIQVLNGARSIRTGHFDEAEATRTAGIAIVDQGNRLDRAMLFEQRANGGFVSREGKVAYVNLTHEKNLTNGLRLFLLRKREPQTKTAAMQVHVASVVEASQCEP
jgi:hypothetical protein